MIHYYLTGPKPKEIKVETFRIDYLIRKPKVEKLSLQPISYRASCRSVILRPDLRCRVRGFWGHRVLVQRGRCVCIHIPMHTYICIYVCMYVY